MAFLQTFTRRLWFRSRGLLLFIILLVTTISLSSTLAVLSMAPLNRLLSDSSLVDSSLVFLQVFFQFLMLVGIVIAIHHYKPGYTGFFSHENWFISLGKGLVPAVAAYGVAFFSTLLIIQVITLFPLDETSAFMRWVSAPNDGFVEIFSHMDEGRHLLVVGWLFYIVVCAPVGEEILFRGFLQQSMSRIFRIRFLDIIFTSLIFGLFHYRSLANMIFAGIIGAFLSWTRKKTGSINRAIWIHALVNFSGLLYGLLVHYFTSRVL
jgi:membrane protease YdiL (CAAX protease family)